MTKAIKPKLGEVRFVEAMEGPRRSVTVSGRELHNHFEFYRVHEIPGALYLAKSLFKQS
jgi:hypothetical protein